MALARVQYEQKEPGNKNFTVPFPYISRDHIKVSVDGVDVPFSWLNDSTVQLDTAPPLGAIIDVRRETERNVLLVDFQDASTLTERQLDLAAQQTFFIAQEAFDATGGTMAVANDGSYSANNRRISNVGYPNSDGDAATVKYVKDVLVSGKDAFEERLLAEAARNKAQQWADANENVQVESGKYSAKHHAIKAAASASSAAMSAADAENYKNIADSHRLAAANSAAAAATSEANALSYRDAADNHRQAAAASAAEAAGYAAGVNLPSALGHGGEYLRQREDESGLEYRTREQMRADLGLGTAATHDVTTSPTDTTGGRLLKVGDFGIGITTLPTWPLATLNDSATTPVGTGHYRISGIPDAPFNGVVLHINRAGGDILQVAFNHTDNQIYFRGYYNNNWRPWNVLYHSGNVAYLISGANLVPASRTISTGTGLTGGGNLSANRTISLANSHIPIGVGQTWQNVTGSRSLGTTYTNTTGRAIMVSISLKPANRYGTVTINVGGVNILSNTFGGLSEYSGYPSFSHSFIVPAGATYRISVDTSIGIQTWAELR